MTRIIVALLLVVGSIATSSARVEAARARPAAVAARGTGAAHAAARASAPVPPLSDMVLDEVHGLLYGSDTQHGKVYVLTLPDLNIVTLLDVGAASQPLGIDLSSDGSTLAVARSAAGNIALIDTTSRTETTTLVPSVSSGPNVPSVVRFGRTGRLYTAGSAGGDVIHVFDTTTHQEIGRSSSAVGANPDLAITADRRTLYDIDGPSGQPRLASFDVTTDAPTVTHETAAGSAQGTRVAIRPDGSAVYTSAGQVWSGDLQHQLGSISPAGSFVAYSPAIDRVFFTGTTPVTNQLTMASATTFGILAEFLTLDGSRTGVFRVNAAGTAAYVSENGELEAVDLRAPDSPGNVTARAGIGSIVVSWTPPLYSGTSAIAGYRVTLLSQRSITVPPTQTSALFTGLSATFSYVFAVTAFNRFGDGTDSTRTPFLSPQPGGTYHALTPARVLDTRTGTGVRRGPLGPGQTLMLQVTGQGGVPALVSGSGVSAVVLNVTATDTSAPSFLAVWPSDVQRPLASSLNWVAGVTVPNLVEVAVSGIGQVSFFNSAGTVDVIADVEGYVGDATNSSGPDGMFDGLSPARVLDTRTGRGPLGPGQSLNLQVTGNGGVPASGVSAVVMNVTATDITSPSFLTAWPAGVARPLASNLNFMPGQTVANRVIVKVGTGGQVSLFNSQGSVDLVVDVSGWFTDATSGAGGSGFTAMVPTRIFDSRIGGTGGPLRGGATLTLTPNGPPDSTGVVLNLTATNVTSLTFLTVWPAGQPQPLASDMDPSPGQTVPSMVVVRLGNGAFDVFNETGSVDVIVDETGLYGAVVQATGLAVRPASARRGSSTAQEG